MARLNEADAIAEELNKLIEKCHESGGHLWIVDKRRNNFSLRLTEPVTIRACVFTAREGEKEDDQGKN